MPKYCIFDLETCGVNPKKIIEIAIYTINSEGNRGYNAPIVDRYSSLVNPGQKVSEHVLQLTGIVESQLHQARFFHQIAEDVDLVTRKATLVAHGSDGDYKVLKEHFEGVGMEFTRKTLCTMELSKKLFPQLKNHSLAHLSDFLGLPPLTLHRAGPDALTCLELFKSFYLSGLGKRYFGKEKTPETPRPRPGRIHICQKEGRVQKVLAVKDVNRELAKWSKQTQKYSFCHLHGHHFFAEIKRLIWISHLTRAERRPLIAQEFPIALCLNQNKRGALYYSLQRSESAKSALWYFRLAAHAKSHFDEIKHKLALQKAPRALGAEAQRAFLKKNNQTVCEWAKRRYHLSPQTFLIHSSPTLHHRCEYTLIQRGTEAYKVIAPHDWCSEQVIEHLKKHSTLDHPLLAIKVPSDQFFRFQITYWVKHYRSLKNSQLHFTPFTRALDAFNLV